MIDSFVTQCPHCRTRFRLSRAQLGAARGEVRCGACRKVFNAGQQLFSESLRSERPAPPVNMPATALPRESMPQEQEPQRSADALTPRAPLERRAEERRKEAEPIKAPAQLPANTAPTSHGYARPAVNPPQSPAQPVSKAVLAPQPPSAAPADIGNPPAAKPFVQRERLKKTHIPQTPSAAGGETEPRLSNARPNGPSATKSSRPASAPLIQTTEPLERLDPPLDRSAASLESDEHDEPLQPDWQPPKSPWGRRLGWGLLGLLAAIGLLGQYTWYNFDELARQNQYRPWLEYVCPLLGCSLPAKVDIHLIKSSNLVVRSHPQFGGALQVDAILYNRAPFSQPFPLLEMRFADRNDQLLASRRFTPSEYLSADQAGQTQMPPQTPIHITLEILDPGPQAVNYSLSFHSPQ